MSQHLHVSNYQQRGCVGCCICEGGARNVARTVSIVGLWFVVLGWITIFWKKCQYCGHNQFMNTHFGLDARPGAMYQGAGPQ